MISLQQWRAVIGSFIQRSSYKPGSHKDVQCNDYSHVVYNNDHCNNMVIIIIIAYNSIPSPQYLTEELRLLLNDGACELTIRASRDRGLGFRRPTPNNLSIAKHSYYEPCYHTQKKDVQHNCKLIQVCYAPLVLAQGVIT